MFTHTHTHTHTHKLYIYITYIYIHTYIHTHTHTHANDIRICKCVCVCVCVYRLARERFWWIEVGAGSGGWACGVWKNKFKKNSRKSMRYNITNEENTFCIQKTLSTLFSSKENTFYICSKENTYVVQRTLVYKYVHTYVCIHIYIYSHIFTYTIYKTWRTGMWRERHWNAAPMNLFLFF